MARAELPSFVQEALDANYNWTEQDVEDVLGFLRRVLREAAGRDELIRGLAGPKLHELLRWANESEETGT